MAVNCKPSGSDHGRHPVLDGLRGLPRTGPGHDWGSPFRMCQECGHVGCCDQSPRGGHATAPLPQRGTSTHSLLRAGRGLVTGAYVSTGSGFELAGATPRRPLAILDPGQGQVSRQAVPPPSKIDFLRELGGPQRAGRRRAGGTNFPGGHGLRSGSLGERGGMSSKAVRPLGAKGARPYVVCKLGRTTPGRVWFVAHARVATVRRAGYLFLRAEPQGPIPPRLIGRARRGYPLEPVDPLKTAETSPREGCSCAQMTNTPNNRLPAGSAPEAR